VELIERFPGGSRELELIVAYRRTIRSYPFHIRGIGHAHPGHEPAARPAAAFLHGGAAAAEIQDLACDVPGQRCRAAGAGPMRPRPGREIALIRRAA